MSHVKIRHLGLRVSLSSLYLQAFPSQTYSGSGAQFALIAFGRKLIIMCHDVTIVVLDGNRIKVLVQPFGG